MSIPETFAKEPLAIFVALAQASYAGSEDKCFKEVDPSLKSHEFKALDRAEVDGYPIYLCSYKDTAGKVHNAVSCKGIFGEEGQFFAGRNLRQAFEAFACFFLPESTIFTRKVHAVFENWKKQFHIEIDTIVGHSAGNRIVKIGRKYLADTTPSVLAIAFNGQRPVPDVVNLTTTGDPVAHTIWDLILGPQTYSVCVGGHSLSEFEACENVTLGRIQNRIFDQEIKKMSGPFFDDLQKDLAKEPIPSEETVNKIESLNTQLNNLQNTEKERQQLFENLVLGFNVGAAVAEGFESWVREDTNQSAAAAASKLEEENRAHLEKLAQQQQTWQRSMHNYSAHMQTLEFASKQLDSNHEELKHQLQSLKQSISEWQDIQRNAQQTKDEAILEQEKILKEKIVEEKKILTTVLKGISTACELASFVVAPFCAPAGAGVNFLGKSVSAASAKVQGKVVSEEIKKQEKVSRVQNRISSLAQQEGFATDRSALQEQIYRETLDRLASNKNIDPKFLRAVLKERGGYWSQKLSEHEGPKKTSAGYKQTPEGKAWEEEYQCLTRIIRENKKFLEKEERVADIRDRAYDVFQYWGTYWSPSDKTTQDFSEALDECIHKYYTATQEERASILQTFAAFEQLFCALGNEQLQKSAVAGQLTYKFLDLGRYGHTTWYPNIKEAFSGPNSFIQNLGGLPKLLTGYVEPLIQFLTCGIQLIQLAKGQELLPTKAEIRTKQLQHISQQIDSLQQTLLKITAKQNQSIQRGFKQTLLAIDNVKEEIQKELKKAASGIEKKLDQQEYDRITDERKRTSSSLKDSFRLKLSKKQTLEVVRTLLLIQLETCERSTQSGPRLPDNLSPLIVPDYLPLIYQNPGHHTATLLSIIDGKNHPAPNLHHYLQLVSNYLQAVQHLGGRKELIDIEKQIISQGKKLIQLMDSYNKACAQASEVQKKLLSLICNKINGTLKAEESKRLTEVVKITSELEQHISEKLVGQARYGLITLFGNQPIAHLKIPSSDEVAKNGLATYPKYWDSIKDTGIGGGIGGATIFGMASLPAIPVVPIAPVVLGFMGGVAGSLLGAVGGAIAAPFIDIEPDIKKCHDFVSKEILKRDFQNKHALSNTKYTINIGTASRLHGLFIDRIFYVSENAATLREIHNSSLSGKKFQVIQFNYGWVPPIHDVGWREVTKEYTDADGDTFTKTKREMYIIVVKNGYYGVNQQICVPSSCALSEAEKTELSKLKTQPGNEQLIKNYLTTAKTQQPTELFTQSFLNKSQWVPSTDSKLIPLAFPKTLMNLFEHEKRRLAIHGLELTPLYSFTQKNKERVLSLEFFVNKKKHSSVQLATFDELTVQSFGAPIITDTPKDEIKHEEPNLNEFLVTAMYTSFQKGVGLPGKETVALRGQTLLAPVDLPFAGVYNLLAEGISTGRGRTITFNSKTYQGDNKVFGDNLAIEKEKMSWEEQRPFEKEYWEYLQWYHTLKAMLSLQVDIPTDQLDTLLFQAGVVLKTSGEMDDLYEQFVLSPKIEELIKRPVQEKLQKFPKTSAIRLSKKHSALIGALHKLEQLQRPSKAE